MAKVGPNAVNLAIAEMIGQLLTFTTHPIEHTERIHLSKATISKYKSLVVWGEIVRNCNWCFFHIDLQVSEAKENDPDDL